MKPEPLYEVIKRWWNEARVLLNPKTEEEFRDEVNNLILLVKSNEKQRVKQLLEEIEKKENEVNGELIEILDGNRKETSVNRGALYGWGEALFWAKRLIKKVFSEVVDE